MRLRFASFNVLATAYLGNGTYTPQALRLLHSKERIPALLRAISKLDADIIGLQEVERPLAAALRASGWWRTVVWTQKANNNPDGCALLVRPNVPKVFIAQRTFTGSDYVMQSLKIGNTFVVNTHLKWSPEGEKHHAGVAQAKELLACLGNSPAIVLGDCNSRPGERVRTLFENDQFRNVWRDTPTAKIVKDGNAEHAPIDLIAVRDVRAEPVGTLAAVADIPNRQYPSDHIPIVADAYLL